MAADLTVTAAPLTSRHPLRQRVLAVRLRLACVLGCTRDGANDTGTHHGLSFPTAKPLEFMRRRTGLKMPSGEGMPQIMPAEILDSSPLQCVVPCLHVHLHHGIALVGENVGQAIPLPPFQYIHGHLIQLHRMRAAALVLIGIRWLRPFFQNPQKSLLNQELPTNVQQGLELDLSQENR